MEKLQQLKEIIEHSNNIVFFGGAGVSTESNIPDFRSDAGLYKQKKYGYNPEQILSRTFFNNNKEIFYDFYFNEMLHPDAKPNKAHIALALLEKQEKLKAIITQNIDNLHQEAGSKNVIELHGSVKRNYCMKCHSFYNEEQMIKYHAICPICNNYIKPDVVLYEECLDNKIIDKALYYISTCDLLIVGGTSLSVYPAASFIRYFNGKYLILINRDKTSYDDYATIVIHDSISKVLESILNKKESEQLF